MKSFADARPPSAHNERVDECHIPALQEKAQDRLGKPRNAASRTRVSDESNASGSPPSGGAPGPP
jgi:hypothetical protein